MSNIKWGCIQPLTGGMYLGAEKAIGHPAEWIISYPGLTDIIKDKDGNVVDAVNERNIYNYLEKNNRLPGYYLMNRGYLNNEEMMCEVDYKPQYTLNGEDATPDFNNMDIVVAVPVCAGLSMASTANPERKKQCNCQMIWMANYALKTIQPKVYIFENAPTLMSGRGDEVRADLEKIAADNGYSIVYYKTDTKFHHNCQKRPRTFIFFFKQRNGEPFIPEFKYENDRINVFDFFNEMPALRDNDPMNVTLDNPVNVDVLVEYFVHRYGNDWRQKVKGDLLDPMAYDKEERNTFMTWLKDSHFTEKEYDWYVKKFAHVDDKMAHNLGWWSTSAKYFADDSLPACMYKNVPVVIHHSENRLYTMREWLYAMGHPVDFDMVGTPWAYFRKMGQNVPANTARWVVSEAVRIVNEWDTINNAAAIKVEQTLFDENGEPSDSKQSFSNVAFFDNTKRKRIY